MKFMNTALFVIAVLCIISCGHKQAEVVNIKKRIFDQPDVLTTAQEDSLLVLINQLDKRVGSQLAVFIIDSLRGEYIEGIALQKAVELRLGREKYDDGILIAVSISDRRIRIEVGKGLEGIVKDEIAARIIREEMSPPFNEKKYFKGIMAAVMTIKELVEENKSLIGKT
jgi:uncharacterized protein